MKYRSIRRTTSDASPRKKLHRKTGRERDGREREREKAVKV